MILQQSSSRPTFGHPADGRAILIDIGGVLAEDHIPAASTRWGTGLEIPPQAFIGALFGGNDDQVLIGRTDEESWWAIVQDRLGVDQNLITEIRSDLASRQTWNHTLLNALHHLRGQTKIAVVSNAWPHMRTRMATVQLEDLMDAVVLSCETGSAKPDPHIYAAALQAVDTDPTNALFIDDTPGHVTTARSLGMTGHVHTNTTDTLTRIHSFLETNRRARTEPNPNSPFS